MATRFCQEPPRYKPKHLRRSPIEPLRVVHHADQGPLLGYLGQQAQHGQTHQEAIRGRTGHEAEGRAERIALRARQVRQVAQHRRAELMNAALAPPAAQSRPRLQIGHTHSRTKQQSIWYQLGWLPELPCSRFGISSRKVGRAGQEAVQVSGRTQATFASCHAPPTICSGCVRNDSAMLKTRT
jgi:hypothetical protein